MDREILFRGRIATSPEALEELDYKGVQHKNGWVFGAYTDGFIVSGVAAANEEYIAMEQWGAVDPETVGQYIGSIDVDSPKVFEGDIIRTYRTNGALNDQYVVEWNPKDKVLDLVHREPGFTTRASLSVLDEHVWELVGNIHDNPELLEVAK